MAERSKAHAWKACIRQKRIEGSNPFLSANLNLYFIMKKYDEKNLYQRKFTKTLMIISSIFLAVNGVGFTFFPNEISVLLTNDDNHFSILILQILGALYLGFSYINWMSKNSLIGGIYNKPLLIVNMLFF